MRIKNLSFALALLTMTAGAQDTTTLTFGPKKEERGNEIDGIAIVVGRDVITDREVSGLAGDRVKIERLIVRKLLLQTAGEKNISVGDTALNIALDKAKKSGKTVSRNQLREEMMIQKLQQQVVNNFVKISDREVDMAVEQQMKNASERLRLIDILVRVPNAADSDTLKRAQETIQQILVQLKTQPEQAVAQDNGAVYNDLGWVPVAKVPINFANTLIDAPIGEYLSPILDSDGIHLLKVLERQASSTSADADSVDASASSPAETRVAHILIKGATRSSKQSIDSIYQKLQSGADFAAVAKQYSQDSGSAVNGGSLSWTHPGQMVSDFEAVMNDTEIDQVSQPFQSKFGYHILKVFERRQAVAKSGREAMVYKARQVIFQKKAAEEWELWVAQLRDESTIEFIK